MRTDSTRYIFEDTWNNPEKKMEPGAQFQGRRERGGYVGTLHAGSQETTRGRWVNPCWSIAHIQHRITEACLEQRETQQSSLWLLY